MKEEIIRELTSVSDEERLAIIDGHIKRGVVIPIKDGIFIGKNVRIESSAVILPGCILCADTSIAASCHIGPNSLLYNTTVHKGASLNSVQSYDSTVMEDADIGPFVQIRPGSTVGKRVHLGNFVEIKNSVIGEDTKVSHLTYVGDSDVGKGVNFGCGCVTVNYTGKSKHRTKIGNHCFIGCNTNLVAPVSVGDYGYTAAGSTITEDVPENALAIARARQVNKPQWVIKKKPYGNEKN